MNNLSVGDIIKCADADDCINTMMVLQKEGIETEFIYEKYGERGLWLEVMEDGRAES